MHKSFLIYSNHIIAAMTEIIQRSMLNVLQFVFIDIIINKLANYV